MTSYAFDELLKLKKKDLTTEKTKFREAIPASIKLAIKIKFLATEVFCPILAYQFRFHKSTVAKFVPELCEVIYNRLKDDCMMVRIFFLNDN